MNPKRKITDFLDTLPYIRSLRQKIDAYEQLNSPLHCNNPIPLKYEILKREKQIFDLNKETREIQINEDEQIKLLENLKIYYKEIPFVDVKQKDLRYYFKNPYFTEFDAIILFLILRYLKPKRIIEIGCGFSSALILDTKELFLNDLECIFIDPDIKRLLSLIKKKEKPQIIKKEVKDVDLNIFKELRENDILFVDSSHVSKVGSDVNHIIFEILPILNKGVIIHFHDIFYPFEYPKEWILSGRAWNEDYLIRAFMQYNDRFKILLFNSFLEYRHKKWLKDHIPLCIKDKGGSFWIKKE